MSDTISRQWLMECVEEGWIKFDTEKDANTYIHLVRDIAPPAQPERKKGKWLKWESLNGLTNGSICSECGYITSAVPNYGTKYCPDCGADMREK